MKKSPYYEKLKTLKALGLIDYPLNRKLSTGQKSHVTKLWNSSGDTRVDLKQYLERPQDFVVRKTGEKTADILSKSGFRFLPGTTRAIIPMRGYETVKLRGSKIEYEKRGKKDTVYLVGKPESMLKKAAELRGKLKRGELLTFKIGENSVSSARYRTLAEMEEYLRIVVWPRFTEEGQGDKFWPLVSIVKITGDLPKWHKQEKTRTKGTPLRTGKRK